MKKTFLIVFSLIFVGFAFAMEATDVAPDINHNSSAIDAQWDVVFDYDVEGATGDLRILGCEFDGTYFWVTGAGAGSEANIHIFDPNGAWVQTFTGMSTSYWGTRDLCFDGTYIYGGHENGFDCYDAATFTYVMTLNWPAGQQFPRASAYDPLGAAGAGSFYTGNFGNPMYEFDRNGNLIRFLTAGPTAVYGMAWDDTPAGGGPWLWIHDQNGSGTDCWQYDPATGAPTGLIVALPVGGVGPIAGGLAYTEEWDPAFSTLIAIGQGTPDMMTGMEMYMLESEVPAACDPFNLNHNNELNIASLDWVNPDLNIVGGTLLELTGVRVIRNGVEEYDLLDVIMGDPYALDDPVPEAGGYAYTLIPYNSYGDGATASASMWIGLDVCGPPENVVAVPDPGAALIADVLWDDPTAGVHAGAYWPPGSFDSFNIYRNGVQIATGVIGNTYHDDAVPISGWYVYGVAAVNASGEGTLAYADEIYVGSAPFEEIPYDWVEINTIGVNSGVTGDDQNLGPFPMGMSFPWYDNVIFNSIRICSNGFLSFTSTSTDYSNNPIPDTPEPNNLVAPYWDDLYPPAGGVMYYYYDAENTRFIIEFDHVMSYGSPRTPQTFEAIFYPDGTIDFMYNEVQAPCINNNTVGVENATGTIGVQCTYNGSGPIEPSSGMGIRIFPLGILPTYNVEIDLEAVLPIQIPAVGGTFDYDATITNLEAFPIPTIDIWVMVELPGAVMWGPAIGPIARPLAAGAIIERTRTQSVPGSAPAGDYLYMGRIGFYPSTIMSESTIPFEKLADGDGAWVASWENWGEDFLTDPIETAAAAPTSHKLVGAYPNPFNPTATINFYLPEANVVKLVVYDVNGRLVATLVDGYRAAGPQEAFFDGSNLASGIYFYHLTSGDFSAAKKMILLK